jgi:hypothetical protein
MMTVWYRSIRDIRRLAPLQKLIRESCLWGTSRVTLEAFVNEAVSNKVRLLCTDKWVGYKHLGVKFPHATVDHAKGQYVVGAVHTQTIEGFWSIFKRGIVGSLQQPL